MYRLGKIDRGRIYAELGEIVAGKKVGRVSNRERVLLVPIGMGSEDIGVAAYLYREAVKRGVGTQLPLF